MSWNTCKYDLCENWTTRPDSDYCETHRRAIGKAEELQAKAQEKRNTLIAKQRAKNQVPRKRVNPVSEKRKEDNIQYSFERARFLAVNTVCQINANEYCTGVATTIHHTAGRIGDLFLDVTKWKGACMSCHQYVEAHPKEAKERGWSESRLTTTEPHKI